MNKYINIEKALESIDLIAENDGEKFDKDSARYAIQTTETADVQEVRHGKWVKQDTSFDLCGVDYYKCSICGKETQTKYPHCPWCAAKMERENPTDK